MKSIIYLTFFLSLSLPTHLQAQYNLKINGACLKITDNTTSLNLKDARLENNGQFSNTTGVVRFSGTAIDSLSSIDGDSTTIFHQLHINKSQNNVVLQQNIIITDSLLFENGKLDLTDQNIHLSDTAGIAGAAATTYIKTSGMGQVFQKIGANTMTFPVGLNTYAPIILDNSVGIADTFNIRVAAGVLDGGNTGNLFNQNAVNLTWFVEEKTEGGSDLDMTVSWYQSEELADFDRANAFLSHYTNGDWDDGDMGTFFGTNPYSVYRLGVTSLSPFSVQSRSCPDGKRNGLLIRAIRK